MAHTLNIELQGDKTEARRLALAHVERLLFDFRRLNSFQNLLVNSRRVNFFDTTGAVTGTVYMQTTHGAEKVIVYVPPPVEKVSPYREVIKRTDKHDKIVPVIMAQDGSGFVVCMSGTFEGPYVWVENNEGYTADQFVDVNAFHYDSSTAVEDEAILGETSFPVRAMYATILDEGSNAGTLKYILPDGVVVPYDQFADEVEPPPDIPVWTYTYEGEVDSFTCIATPPAVGSTTYHFYGWSTSGSEPLYTSNFLLWNVDSGIESYQSVLDAYTEHRLTYGSSTPLGSVAEIDRYINEEIITSQSYDYDSFRTLEGSITQLGAAFQRMTYTRAPHYWYHHYMLDDEDGILCSERSLGYDDYWENTALTYTTVKFVIIIDDTEYVVDEFNRQTDSTESYVACSYDNSLRYYSDERPGGVCVLHAAKKLLDTGSYESITYIHGDPERDEVLSITEFDAFDGGATHKIEHIYGLNQEDFPDVVFDGTIFLARLSMHPNTETVLDTEVQI